MGRRPKGYSMMETTGEGAGGVLNYEDRVTFPVGYSMIENHQGGIGG